MCHFNKYRVNVVIDIVWAWAWAWAWLSLMLQQKLIDVFVSACCKKRLANIRTLFYSTQNGSGRFVDLYSYIECRISNYFSDFKVHYMRY